MKMISDHSSEEHPLRAMKIGSIFEYQGATYTKISHDFCGNDTCRNEKTGELHVFSESHFVLVNLISYPEEDF